MLPEQFPIAEGLKPIAFGLFLERFIASRAISNSRRIETHVGNTGVAYLPLTSRAISNSRRIETTALHSWIGLCQSLPEQFPIAEGLKHSLRRK